MTPFKSVYERGRKWLNSRERFSVVKSAGKSLRFHQSGVRQQNIVLRNAQMVIEAPILIKLKRLAYDAGSYFIPILATPKEENFARMSAQILLPLKRRLDLPKVWF